jgi:transcriptional regulator with XRE-family HTH domain
MTISVTQPYSGHEANAPFAQKIASARNLAGYTVEQLAITCGLTTDEILALENGSDSDPARLKRLAAALQIPLASIL